MSCFNVFFLRKKTVIIMFFNLWQLYWSIGKWWLYWNSKDSWSKVFCFQYSKQFCGIESAAICFDCQLTLSPMQLLLLDPHRLGFNLYCQISELFDLFADRNEVETLIKINFDPNEKWLHVIRNNNTIIARKNFSNESCNMFCFSNLSCRRRYSAQRRMSRKRHLHCCDLWISIIQTSSTHCLERISMSHQKHLLLALTNTFFWISCISTFFL